MSPSRSQADEDRPKPLDLVVDLVPEQTVDDTDAGWGERAPAANSDLRRLLDDVPPHHGA